MTNDVKKISQLKGHKGSVYALAHHTKNHCIYSAGGDGWIAAWQLNHLQDGKLIAQLEDQIFSLILLPNSNYLIAGTMAGDLYFIPLHRKEEPRRFYFHKKGVFDLLSFKEKIYSAGGDGKLGIWDEKEQELIEAIALSYQSLRSLSLAPDQSLLAVGSSDQRIYILSLPTLQLFHTIEKAHRSSVFSLTFSPDGKYLISGGRDAQVNIWDVEEGFALHHQLGAHWYTINDLTLDAGQKILFTGSRDKTIRLWNLKDFSLQKELNFIKTKGHINSVNALLCIPEHSYLFSASDDRSIIAWQY